MARNEEKAQAMLNRWYTMKRNLHAKPQDSRPSLYNEFTSLTECEKWRYKNLLFYLTIAVEAMKLLQT